MSRDDETILWHDYETTGLDPRSDRPMSFAAQRTTLALEPIGDPVTIEFAVADDVLPSPDACLVTGLDPDRPGTVSELEGARTILEVMMQPRTCGAGFNSMRFDDELTRFMLWRNLLPPYERESRNGNSRFDLIDVLRAACALRPEGMEWPEREPGVPGFKLEDLAAANGIPHDAHDALGDVRATIALARKLRSVREAMFDYLAEARQRSVVQDRIRAFRKEPFVHVSARFPAATRCASLVVRVADHPRFRNQILCLDLRCDPQRILDLDVAELRARLFTPREERPADEAPLGIKGIHFGRCPVVAPKKLLDDASIARLALDMAACDRHAQFIEAHRDALEMKLAAVFDEEPLGKGDVDQALYEGFVEDEDAAVCREVHASRPERWRDFERSFEDARLGELLFRMRARNHPETLGATEHGRWRTHCAARLAGADGLLARIVELRAEGGHDAKVLDAVEASVRRRVARLG
ncbi:MAG: exodeoxyribonuclease I [Planctomycetes bacterium]|nr:exodeoxyribonuclease I [Planctomycetota bacterium]